MISSIKNYCELNFYIKKVNLIKLSVLNDMVNVKYFCPPKRRNKANDLQIEVHNNFSKTI